MKDSELFASGRHYLRLLCFILLGNMMLAFAVCAFVVPQGFMLGGVTGVALALQSILPLRLSTITAGVNISLFFLGLIFLGKEFAAASLLSTFLFPTLLRVMESLPLVGLFQQDCTIAALFTAIIMGAGVGLIIRAGGSSGGMDIPPCILQKYRGIPVGNSMFFFDVFILAAQVWTHGFSGLLYSLLILALTSWTVNHTVVWSSAKVQVVIISRHYNEICYAILHRANCGASLLPIEGGWSGETGQAVLSVIYARQYTLIKKLALDIDPTAFIVASNVTGVMGEGYTLRRSTTVPEKPRSAAKA